MNIAMNHGYLLTGTGSNLYVRNLVREFCAAGHDVYLLCQEFHPEAQDFVAEVYEFDDSNTRYHGTHRKETGFPGKCRCFKPNLGGLLPVYVFDHYDGYTVKTLPDCSEDEVQGYVDRNVAALQAVVDQFDIDVVQTNHTVMLPYIVSRLRGRSRFRHFATVHGSALNFTVKQHARFVPYAVEGLGSADEIFVDSKHAHDELEEFFARHDLADWQERVTIIPAGVDVTNFVLRDTDKGKLVDRFCADIAPVAEQSSGREPATTREITHFDMSAPATWVAGFTAEVRARYDYRFVDRDVVDKLRAIDFAGDRIVLFIGKYLWTKGLHVLLLAVPLVLRRHPDCHFILVGFGPFREAAELMLAALAEGRLDELTRLVRARATPFHGDSGEDLPLLAESLDRHRDVLARTVAELRDELGRDIRDHVTFTGIVTHEHLGHLLPCADILVAPSVFPEAFGMVAIEAMACGVYPIVTYQSAFREIADELEAGLDVPGLAIRHVTLDADAAVNITENVASYLAVLAELESRPDSAAALADLGRALRDIAVASYSWQGISRKYLSHYTAGAVGSASAADGSE